MEITILVTIYVIIIGGFTFNTWLSYLNYKNRNAEIPEEVNDVYDNEEYKKWLNYSMENYRFSSIVNVFSTAIFLLMLIFGVFVWFNKIALGATDSLVLQVVIFLGLYFLVSFITGIFTSYYQTFTIEEKYGFNKMTKKTFIFDKIKSLLLTIVFGGGLVVLIFKISENTGNMFYVYTWLALVVILLLVQVLYVNVIVPMFNKLTPLEEGDLKDEINAFANKVGYEVSAINVMDASKRSSKLNAFFSGFGKFKKIVLYDTLIEKMSTEEIVAVLAHEIGHNKHKHVIFNIGQMMITMMLYIGILGLVLNEAAFSEAFGFDSANFGFSLVLFFVLLEPIGIILGLLTSYFSRKHEYQADRFASVNYGKKPMENALKVLGRANFANLTPHPLYVKLSYSHPPIVDRIKAIKKVEDNE